MSAPDAAREHWLARHAAWAPRRAGEPAWLAALRREARDAFAATGLPHVRMEEWRYTNVAPIARVAFEPAGAEARVSRAALEAVASPVYACSFAAFVDGRHRPELSTPPAIAREVHVQGLRELLAREPDAIVLCYDATSGPPAPCQYAERALAVQPDFAARYAPAAEFGRTEFPAAYHVVFERR